MIKNRIEYIAFLFLAGLFRILGITLSRRFASSLGTFFYYAVPLRKKTVIENLKTAFPGKGENEIRYLTKKTYQNFSLTFSELLSLKNLSKKELDKIIDFSSADSLLKKYISANKSFFLLTGHFGNWEMSSTIPLYYGKRINAMAKAMRNNYVSDWINSSREKFGVKVVLLGPSIREIYQLLKENGIILVVGDQRGPSDGVRVNFFGKPTAAFNGTAVLALKTSSPILMIFFVRQKERNYKVVVEELKYDDLTGSQEEKIKEICQRYFTFLESMICKYPDQWFWMHKIWKY